MTEKGYKEKLETILGAIRVAGVMVSTVSADDIKDMEGIISKADALAFVLVRPIDFDQSNQNLEDAREAIRVLREIRKFINGVRGRK